jgi:hypothetical protein
MTSEAQKRALLPHATVIEDDSVLREMSVGVRVVTSVYEPPEDDPLREFGGFTLPRPLYYSRTIDEFFILSQHHDES